MRHGLEDEGCYGNCGLEAISAGKKRTRSEVSDNVFHDVLCRIICQLATSVVNFKFTHRGPIDLYGANFETAC